MCTSDSSSAYRPLTRAMMTVAMTRPVPLLGYSFAWVGHFFFEKNRPATFKHPFYSLAGDFVMFKDVLTRRIPW